MPTTELKVTMTCGGCKNAVEKKLGKTEGVSEYTVDVETQKVTVTHTLTDEEVLAAVKKTGKETVMWSN